MSRVLTVIIALTSLSQAQEPLLLASHARLWLKVPAGQPALGEVRITPGKATPAAWEREPAVRRRHTDMTAPIHWWKWTEITIRFTPAADGSVDLDLNGPWAPEKNGLMPRQDVLWDGLTASGTELRNGGFEEMAENQPAHWRSPWSAAARPETWPLADSKPIQGKRLAATWSKSPLVQTLELKAGVPVTIRLHARAATPPQFVKPKILGPDTPAHQALAGLTRGVNLGNGFETPPDQNWGVHFTTDDIDRIADEGFDHIRVPVAWHFRVRPENHTWQLDPAFLTELEPLLRKALDRKLQVLLNWHHFNDLTTDPAAHRERFVAVWDAIARHFQAWPPGLFFELLNEPCGELSTETANPIQQQVIAAIRKTNPTRILVVSPGRWGNVGELDKLRLPDADDRLVVTVHCYEPFHFTHQGAGWVGLTALRNVRYPGPPETPLALPAKLAGNQEVRVFLDAYNTLPGDRNPCSIRPIRAVLDEASVWSRHFGRPIHLGEFGCHNVGDSASRARYLKDVRSLAEARRIPWTLWEWKAGFGYWDPDRKQPRFREALME